jgi:hypothetical protein
MATIKISSLPSNGSALFEDEESLLKELTVEDESAIYGGYGDVPFCPVGPKPITKPSCIYIEP